VCERERERESFVCVKGRYIVRKREAWGRALYVSIKPRVRLEREREAARAKGREGQREMKTGRQGQRGSGYEKNIVA
jgi:hypothetical protein